VFAAIATSCLLATASLMAGWQLLHGAQLADKTRATGSEAILHAAIRARGRAIAVLVVTGLLIIIAALALSLWLGWEKAFPPPPPKSERGVAV
jgi:hypothetical protein